MDNIVHTPLPSEKQPGYGPREFDQPVLSGEQEPFYDPASSEPELHAEARTQGMDPDNIDAAEELLHTAEKPADSTDAFENVNDESDSFVASDVPSAYPPAR